MLPGIIPLPAINARYTYAGAQTDAAPASTTVAFTVYFGPKSITSTSRLIVIPLSWVFVGTTNLNSATIGGVSATIHGQNDGTNCGTAIISAVVPDGEQLSVSLVFDNQPSSVVVFPFMLNWLASNTPADSNFPAGAGSASRTVTLDVANNGMVFAVANDVLGTPAWTNATELATPPGTTVISAAVYFGNSESNRVLTANPARVMSAVSFA
jgi:hypothetical protein